ncbi:MAG: hypothetical protein DCC57_07105 [Chloroflexi bacterium]|nr:MAG: hypothetical protein DCC57_07105 [Chloroflexota bacterium]
MRFTLATCLPSPAEQVWAEVQTSRLMVTIIKPWVYFAPLDPPVLPAVWTPGAYRGRMSLWGVIPFGEHTIRISFPKIDRPDEYQVLDNGGGQIVARWDHRIIIRRLDHGHTLYVDQVDIAAGWLTPLVWLYAQGYYRYRQRRWRRLIRARFDYSQF